MPDIIKISSFRHLIPSSTKKTINQRIQPKKLTGEVELAGRIEAKPAAGGQKRPRHRRNRSAARALVVDARSVHLARLAVTRPVVAHRRRRRRRRSPTSGAAAALPEGHPAQAPDLPIRRLRFLVRYRHHRRPSEAPDRLVNRVTGVAPEQRIVAPFFSHSLLLDSSASFP